MCVTLTTTTKVIKNSTSHWNYFTDRLLPKVSFWTHCSNFPKYGYIHSQAINVKKILVYLKKCCLPWQCLEGSHKKKMLALKRPLYLTMVYQLKEFCSNHDFASNCSGNCSCHAKMAKLNTDWHLTCLLWALYFGFLFPFPPRKWGHWQQEQWLPINLCQHNPEEFVKIQVLGSLSHILIFVGLGCYLGTFCNTGLKPHLGNPD